MEHRAVDSSRQVELADLFRRVFTASEGEHEGTLIGDLASRLAPAIDDEEILCFGSYDDKELVAGVFFSRLRFRESVRVFMLSPMATRTDRQRQGIGTDLINHALGELRKRSVSVVVTYGDSAFYERTGFTHLSESILQAPLKLSLPHGWLGQSLAGGSIPTIHGRPTCVGPFNNPAYW
jgi:putative acetyltransferase